MHASSGPQHSHCTTSLMRCITLTTLAPHASEWRIAPQPRVQTRPLAPALVQRHARYRSPSARARPRPPTLRQLASYLVPGRCARQSGRCDRACAQLGEATPRCTCGVPSGPIVLGGDRLAIILPWHDPRVCRDASTTRHRLQAPRRWLASTSLRPLAMRRGSRPRRVALTTAFLPGGTH
jgi:hypothetical protein